jgi:serine-type D-Ala-D-Ala carboxypeptidase/endopeptidase (penicillin-binding protein 4)
VRLTSSSRRSGLVVAVVALTAALSVPAATASATDDPDPRITAVMDKPAYATAQWGLLQVDPSSGQVARSQFPDQSFLPGSVTKLFSVSAAWGTLGADHRFETPVYAVGGQDGSTVTGDLVLVAQGDLTMGGRTEPDGAVAFTDIDHTYANDLPGATLTPEDPLAGLDSIADQVKAAGITRVAGDVVIDDRAFSAVGELDPTPTPLIINDNLIDLLTTPTSPGQPADFSWRPQVSTFQVTSDVRTVAADGPTDIQVTTSPDGHQISVSGTIAAGSQPQLRVAQVEDASAFGRTAFIEALGRAGVTVDAPTGGPNPVDQAPGSYASAQPVASYVSPVFAEYAKLILKVSHNLGANLTLCLMAVHAGSTDCMAGFPAEKAFLQRAGVDTDAVSFSDGRGGTPEDRVTPRAVTQILEYWLGTPDADRFRTSLPVLGVDGSLGEFCTSCPAQGKVFAKTGTVAGLDDLNQRLQIGAMTLGGYLEAGEGRYEVFYVGVTGATATTIEELVDVLRDVADIGAFMQEGAAASATAE